MRDRRQFLTAAAAFAAGATVGAEPADGKTQLARTILNGRGAPPKRLGAVGDFYIDDDSHSIYGPKRETGWGRPTSLIGPAGARGSSGTSGKQGATGQIGAKGSQGAEGYGVLSGEGPPAASFGVDNDFYIDTASTQLYGPKHGGVWGSPISLTGSSQAIAVSTDGTDGLPDPTGHGLEMIIATVGGAPQLQSITYNGTDV